MDANDELAMVVADDHRDFVPSDETSSDKETEFMKFCRKSFRMRQEYPTWGKVSFEEWRTCVAMMVLVGGTDLQNHDDTIFGIRTNFSPASDRKTINQVWLHQEFTCESCRGQLLEEKFRPLKYLESFASYLPGMDPNPILKMLTTFDFCTKERLKKISLCSDPLSADNVETLFFQVVPRFPNLTTLELSNQIASNANAFEAIANRIEREGSSDVSTSLRCVVFMEIIHFDSNLKRVIGTLLQHFASIAEIRVRGVNRNILLDDELGFPLLRNIVGWRRLEGKEIPLAIWPMLLHRAQIKIDEYPDNRYSESSRWQCMKESGIYYLLREGSALIGRRDLGSRRSSKRKYGEV